MLSQQEFVFVQQWMRQQAGITLGDVQKQFVESRLLELARQDGYASLTELIGRMRQPSASRQIERVVAALTVNETLFFRDGHPFEALRHDILPDLIERRRSSRSLTIWSAACSTGQEAYSIAMLLADAFPELGGWDVAIIGTDVASTVVARARDGRYNAFEMGRGLPETYRERFFVRSHADWEVSSALRRRVSFRQMNLAGGWTDLPTCDLILLRNVLIYFDPVMRATLIDRAGRQLRPFGYLMLGGSESMLQPPSWCEAVTFGKTVCYQRRAGSWLTGPEGDTPLPAS